MKRPVSKTILISLSCLLILLLIVGLTVRNQGVSANYAAETSFAARSAFSQESVAPVRVGVIAESQATSFEVKETPCPASLDPSEIEEETVICGAIAVPEDYTRPNGAQMQLVFATLKSTSLSPAPDPVIYLHGGPGAAELRSLEKMTERFAPIRQTRDVVIFDQRGTGFSNGRLLCDVEYATQQDAARESFRDIAGDSNVANEDVAVNMTMFAVCLDRFEEIGTDLSQYNTINNAQDVVNVAAALGYNDFNLYGFSYGTQLALEVMRRHPEKVRSVILDSVAPADIKLYENFGLPNVEAITSLFAICAADEDCREAYPDLQNRFVTLLENLNEQPIEKDDGSVITADDLIAALRQSDIRPGLGAYIPLMVWELEQGTVDTLEAILNNELPPAISAVDDPLAWHYAGLELSPDAELFISSGLNLRQEARQLSTLANNFLERGDRQIALDDLGSSPAVRFDFLFHESMNQEPLDRRLTLNQAYLTFPIKGETVEDLRRFVGENFQGSNAARLLAPIDEMTDADVEELATIIFGKARDYAHLFNVSLALSLYMCQEHVPYNTIDGALDAFAELEIPQVAPGKLRTVQNLFAYCQLFPTGLEPEEFHDPVVSDIPTLILLGSADTQTAISWGQHAAESLENSEVVIFPETGHGAIRYSQCARDIGAAFFNRPGSDDLDITCTEELFPLFELPPE